jgi:hypothetical protein
MRLAEDVQRFSGACERLLATAATSSRTLTEDEARIVQYYCKEIAEKRDSGEAVSAFGT